MVFTPGLRPAISRDVIRKFEEKRQRLSPGYAPTPDRELVDWVKERIVIPWPEWQRLIEAMGQNAAEEKRIGEYEFRLPDEVSAKLVRLRVPGAPAPFVASLERLAEILAGFYPESEVSVETFGVSGEQIRRERRPPELSGEEKDELLTALLGEWVQFYGPLRPEETAALLALDHDRLELGLEDLKDSDVLISGRLVKEDSGELVCDAANFETLMRLERAAAVPQVEPRRIEDLPLFLAHIQGVTIPGSGEEGVFSALERLVGYDLPASLWESDIIPARVPGYSTTELDAALQQGNLRWQGSQEKTVRILFEQDFELLQPENAVLDDEGAESVETKAGPDPSGLFVDPQARYDFGALLGRFGGDIAALEEKLWQEVWRGKVTNDTFSALRRGLQTEFRVAQAIARQKQSLRFASRRTGLHLSHWQETRAYPGSWFLLQGPQASSVGDLIDEEERRKDRVRLLLDRYGILFRELLTREQPPLRWPDIFRTLRLMELSGEVLAGYFFSGIPGPQFISQRAFRLFLENLPREAVFWMSAVDPASPCGLAVEALRGSFPKRVEGTHLVFCGERLAMISQRRGGALTFMTPPDDPRLGEYLGVLRHLLKRQFDPMRRVIIETINDEPAAQSPYLAALKQNFEVVVDVKQVSLYRRVEK
jgi:ATP-dependent Lhr-like helicase